MFTKIIKHIAKLDSKKLETPFPELDSLKEINTPSARLYNWNILSECFKKLNIYLEPDIKSLIIAGD